MATKKKKSPEEKKDIKTTVPKKKSKAKSKKVDRVEKPTTEEVIILEESIEDEVIEVKVVDKIPINSVETDSVFDEKEESKTDAKKIEEEDKEKDPTSEKDSDKVEADNFDDIDDDEFTEEEYDSLNIWEKFVKFEGDTKIGVAVGIFILISNPMLLNWDWVNHSWFIILILAFISLRYLNKQRLELEEDKPFEAKFANISFIVVLVLLVLRDIVITSRLDDLFEIISR